ncbi:MAG: hypothetical protein SRB2_01246 [Desulfobacteraceae bacterium Eth-SRB2]|nr:MAG: hypothetical protein SRB2_01246 [Desulfobacteraceae bacterium Eth-SRB2]
MDFFEGMKYVDGAVCNRTPAEGKVSDLGDAKKRVGLDVIKGLKLLTTLPLSRWKMRTRYRINGQAMNLVSAVLIHVYAVKTAVADYSWRN